MNTTMTMNATLNAILNATISAKRKNDEGKFVPYTTTMLEDNFKHVPKSSDLDENGKTAMSALEKTFEYMERTATATTDSQRNKCADKAAEYARSYLKAVGMNAGTGNVSMLTATFAPKKQTTKGTVKGGYTTKSTFIKYALYLAYHFTQTGMWCDVKSNKSATTSVSKSIKSFDDLVEIYINNFGFSPETAKNLAEKAREAKAQVGKVA